MREAAFQMSSDVTSIGPATPAPEPAVPAASGAPAPTILVVEDDPEVRTFVAATLDAHGYAHQSASTGREAIALAATSAPDIILLDLGLPDIDGIEVVRAIRVWSVVPIIVVSARSEDADKIGALDAGADDYLTKPFSVGELLARIRTTVRRLSHLSEAAGKESPTFVNGDLSIDYTAGMAYLAGAELHLTPIEFKLLYLLSRNVDKVLTHSFILREVWGSEKQTDLASLRVFMGTLRKKIEPDPVHPRYIQTHVGVGYRMLRVSGGKDAPTLPTSAL